MIINGFWESGSRPPHKYRASVTFKCKPEYTMVGNPTVTCNIDSKWSPGLPKCTSKLSIKIIKCNSLSTVLI